MIKKMRVCECDICGKIASLVTYPGEWIPTEIPRGWIQFDKNLIMCPTCAVAFKNLKEGEHETD